MTKIALINDLHFQARNASQVFADYFNKFYQHVFIPYLKEHDIKHVAMLGDITDSRKYLNFLSGHRVHNDLMKPLSDAGVNVYVFPGNHDAYYKADNSINSLRVLYGDRELPGMHIVDKPTEFEFDGCTILMLPWIASGNMAESFQVMKKTKADILFAHLELAGFEMYQGNFIEHGMDKDLFSKFDMVMTGHYHHKSTQGNIHYLGTQFEITWADYNDQKGFHVFDTETRELEFVPNPYKIFKKVYYDDIQCASLDDVMAGLDVDELAGCYVKLVVSSKSNPYWFDVFFDALEKSELVNLQIVDESLNIYSEYQDTEGTVEDTITILNKYIEGLDLDTDKAKLEGLMKNLYEEAVSIVEQV